VAGRRPAPACLLTVGVLLLAGCGAHQADEAADKKKVAVTQIDGLPHGSIAVVPGSPEDALAKFLASDEDPPRTFLFNGDQFAPWSDQMTPLTKGTLANIALILRDYPRSKIKIAGYTDNAGGSDANLALSRHRVDALKALLIQRGVARSRIEAVGEGMIDPIGNNQTADGRARNRRIEITVTAKE
jgi:outer membrane protein OmpA-like peptidoglycan-associated protein